MSAFDLVGFLWGAVVAGVLFNAAWRRFPSLEVLDPLAWRRREVSIRFSLARQTRLLMIVNLSGEFDYQITLDGP